MILLIHPAQADEMRDQLLDPSAPRHGSALHHFIRLPADEGAKPLMDYLKLDDADWIQGQKVIDRLGEVEDAALVSERDELFMNLGSMESGHPEPMLATRMLVFLARHRPQSEQQAKQEMAKWITSGQLSSSSVVYLLHFAAGALSAEDLSKLLESRPPNEDFFIAINERDALRVLVDNRYEEKPIVIERLLLYRDIAYPEMAFRGDVLPVQPDNLFIDRLVQEVQKANRPNDVAKRYEQLMRDSAHALHVLLRVAEEVVRMGGHPGLVDALGEAVAFFDPRIRLNLEDDPPPKKTRGHEWHGYEDLFGEVSPGFHNIQFSRGVYPELLQALALSLAKVQPSTEEEKRDAYAAGERLAQGFVEFIHDIGQVGADEFSYRASDRHMATTEVAVREIGEAIGQASFLPANFLVELYRQAKRFEPIKTLRSGMVDLATRFSEVSYGRLEVVLADFEKGIRQGKGCRNYEVSEKWADELGHKSKKKKADLIRLRETTCVAEAVYHHSAVAVLAMDAVPHKGEWRTFGYHTENALYQRARESLQELPAEGDLQDIRHGVEAASSHDAPVKVTLAGADRFARGFFATAAPLVSLMHADQLEDASLPWLDDVADSDLPGGCFGRVLGDSYSRHLVNNKNSVPTENGQPCAHGRWEKKYELGRRQAIDEANNDSVAVREKRTDVIMRYLDEFVAFFNDGGFVSERRKAFLNGLRFADQQERSESLVRSIVPGAEQELEGLDEQEAELVDPAHRKNLIRSHLRGLNDAWRLIQDIVDDRGEQGFTRRIAHAQARLLWRTAIATSPSLLDNFQVSVFFGDDFTTDDDETEDIWMLVATSLLTLPSAQRTATSLYTLVGAALHDIIHRRLDTLFETVIVGGFTALNEARTVKDLLLLVGEVQDLPYALTQDPTTHALYTHADGFTYAYNKQYNKGATKRFWLQFAALGVGIVLSIVSAGMLAPLVGVLGAMAIGGVLAGGVAYAASIPENQTQEQTKDIEDIESQTRIRTDDLEGKEGIEALPLAHNSAFDNPKDQLYFCSPTQRYVTHQRCDGVIARNHRLSIFAGLSAVGEGFMILGMAKLAHRFYMGYRIGAFSNRAARIWKTSRIFRTRRWIRLHPAYTILGGAALVLATPNAMIEIPEEIRQTYDDFDRWYNERENKTKQIQLRHELQRGSIAAAYAEALETSDRLGISMEELLLQREVVATHDEDWRMKRQLQEFDQDF